jgi:hypothetical protein
MEGAMYKNPVARFGRVIGVFSTSISIRKESLMPQKEPAVALGMNNQRTASGINTTSVRLSFVSTLPKARWTE